MSPFYPNDHDHSLSRTEIQTNDTDDFQNNRNVKGGNDKEKDNAAYQLSEGVYVSEPEPREEETHRSLKPRQISMIAIGGAIGTGLVIGSGSSLARSGPGSLLISYIIMGIVCFSVMLALGEMSTRYPSKKGFAGHGTRCVDPAFGFATALVYLCKYLIISPNQIVAGSLVIRFWNSSINGAAWVSIFIVFVIAINCLGIKWFGEVEFWLSMIKITTLTGLILLGLIIDLGGVPGQERLGFRYWHDGRAFKAYKTTGGTGKFCGFVNALVLALFAYMGTELIGVTVGEAKNPRKTVPAAIKKTFFRILFFYIIGVLIVGMIVDSSSTLLAQAAKKGTSGGASASPFVVAIQAAGIRVLPQIINACILIFTISAANSDQYIATRTLYGMAKDGNAPRIFTRCTSRGVPWVAFVFTGAFMGLAYLVASDDALTIFNYFVSTVTIFGSLTWISILASHIGFMRGMKAQGLSRDTLPYKAPFQPYLSYFALFFTCLLSFFKGFDAFMPFDYKSFITHYIGIPVYVFGYTGYKLIRRTRYVRLNEMDLSSGAREFADLDGEDEMEPISLKGMPLKDKVVYWLKNW
ncbi:putative amino acid transporter [Naematelia encephala]|uniref:Putative amino acid transporter n=1 Tax=Naematelia encephala TaxID=71784 RepID=A0A1Y2BLF8_9TREE|nr:putative amino acid transporter [Naematelia encephala]